MIKAYLYPTPAELQDQLDQREAALRADDERNRLRQNSAILADDPYERGTSRFTESLDEDFVWKTHSGEEYYPYQMATMHLFYAVRMLFNNTCPPAFRVGKFRRYRDVATWSPEYVRRAGQALHDEITSRDDLDLVVTDSESGDTIEDQMIDMETNALVLKRLGIDAANPVS